MLRLIQGSADSYERSMTKLKRGKESMKILKKLKDIGLYIGIAVGILFLMGLIGSLLDRGDEKEKALKPLKPSVSFTGTQFILANNDNFDWTNVKFEVNSGILKGGFVLTTQRIVAGETYTVGAMQFTKGDGTRLNPFTMKPQNLSIWCDTPKGKGFWYGEWD